MQYVGLDKKLFWYGNISNTYIMDFSHNRRPAHMKAYTFIFTTIHNTNYRCKSTLLANHERESLYFAFTGRACPPLLLRFFCPARNPPLRPSNPNIFVASANIHLLIHFQHFTMKIKYSQNIRNISCFLVILKKLN
jgi:hypothetical protein